MSYNADQKATAVEIIQKHGGLTADAIDAVRSLLNAPGLSKSTLHGWLKAEPNTEPKQNRTEPTTIARTSPADAHLTDKQQAFIEHYFICKLNGTEAVLAVYDTTDRAVAASMASDLLSLPKIRARIEDRLREWHLTADEVLARLAFHARGSMEEFIDADSATIDLAKAKKAKQLGLIKKFKTKFTTFTSKDGDETETSEIEIELYDQQAALVHLGKHLGLFAADTNLNINLTNLSDEQLRSLADGKKVIDVEAVR